jgi:hypothetical protein
MKGGSPEAGGLAVIKVMTPPGTTMFWWQYVEAIRFGETDEVIDGLSTAYTFHKATPAIFDTGTSLSGIPYHLAGDIFGRLLQGRRYSKMNGEIYSINCD